MTLAEAVATPIRKSARLETTAPLRSASQTPLALAAKAQFGPLLFRAGKMHASKAFYERMLQADPASREAHAGLYYAHSALEDKHTAASHLGQAHHWPAIVTLPYRGAGAPVPILLLLSLNAGNVLILRFLNDRIFQTYVVIVEFCTSSTVLPPHRLVVNGIGDADVRSQALEAAQSILARTRAPVVNPPAAVLVTGRSSNAVRLSAVPGVLTPRTTDLPRKHLESANAAQILAGHGFSSPLLVRAPGYHMGQHFHRVDSPGQLPAALAELPGSDVIVIEYLDGCGSDGKIRKYRVLMVGGHLYPVHLAISSQWKIHYFSAEMEDHPEHRAEEAAFLSDMPAVLGLQTLTALRGIQSALGLDYGGVDFGLNARGQLLIYEANATMAVYRPDPDPKWDYRRPSIERIYTAVREFLLARAG